MTIDCCRFWGGPISYRFSETIGTTIIIMLIMVDDKNEYDHDIKSKLLYKMTVYFLAF
jgi:hypothetical protein